MPTHAAHPAVPVFEARSLIKRFGRLTALKSIDLKVNEGEFIAVFGANGAGKTTLLKIAAMLMIPSDGQLFLRGENIRSADTNIRRQIGFISHSIFLYHNLTARENLRFYGKMYSVENLDKRIDEQLEIVGLSARADDAVRGFSRGMQQRLTIARAFLHNPSILLLDEPYTGLDRSAAEMLNNLLGSLNSAQIAGLMTTHNIDQGYDLATHVAILHKGEIKLLSETRNITKEQFRERYAQIVH